MRTGLLLLVPVFSLLSLAPGDASAERRVSEETVLFRRLRGGICTVYAEDGQGSGFLVDSTGIILTNDHVVGRSSRIRVKFDDSTRVSAAVLATDDKKDIAAIRVSPVVVVGYPILPLATESDSMVFEGEKAIAIGSPLNQDKIMTSGIVSKVEPTAIISDVNINHGNSGGPLINMDGQVIAINTFGDFTRQGGPGISGSIKITEAYPTLARARAAMDTLSVPDPRRLPMASRVPFPIDSLRTVAESDKFDRTPYEVSDLVGTGKFNVVVVTPVYDAWRSWRSQVALGKGTKRREVRGGGTGAQTYDAMRDMREWMRYTGEDYAPIVTIQLAPKIGQTAGSIFGNILGAAAAGAAGGSYYRGSYQYEFKADFLKAEVTRDSLRVDDLNLFRAMIPAVYASADWGGTYRIEDQARTGIFQCDPAIFAPVHEASKPKATDSGPYNRRVKDPDSAGDIFPTIHVKVWSVEKPNQPYEFNLPRATVRRVWADFASWRAVASGR